MTTSTDSNSSLHRRPAGSTPRRFTPSQRLRHKREFDRVYKAVNKRFSNKHFTVLVLPNEVTHARIGLSIAARNVGNAVARNRVKRIIRESFRQHQHELPCVDIVVNAKAGIASADNASLRSSLERHWSSVSSQCARS